jgi:cell division protein FtsZ
MNELLWVSSIPLAYLLYKGTKVTYNDVMAYYKNKELDNLSNEEFEKKVKLIGVGGGGSAIVEYLNNKYPNRYDSIILNSDKKALTSKNVTNKIHLEKPDNLGCGSNTLCGYNLINDSVIEKLKSFINTDKKVFIFATLGGGCGSGSVKALSQYLTVKDLDIQYFLTTPFSWEGLKRTNRANETIEFLKNNNAKTTVFSNDELLKFGNLTMKDCFHKQDEDFNKIIGLITNAKNI